MVLHCPWPGQYLLEEPVLLFVKLPETREEEEFRSDNQKQEDIDSTGEVEHCGTEKRSRRRYIVVSEQ
jgi:hypothetical protein